MRVIIALITLISLTLAQQYPLSVYNGNYAPDVTPSTPNCCILQTANIFTYSNAFQLSATPVLGTQGFCGYSPGDQIAVLMNIYVNYTDITQPSQAGGKGIPTQYTFNISMQYVSGRYNMLFYYNNYQCQQHLFKSAASYITINIWLYTILGLIISQYM